MTAPKKATIHINYDDILVDYQRHALNSLNMIAFILKGTSALEFNEIPDLPVFMKVNIGQLDYKGDKKDFLDKWLFNHGLGDIIKGINLGLARANYLEKIRKLKGETLTFGTYEELEQSLNKKFLKMGLPEGLEKTSNNTGKSLKYDSHIKSINSIRKCLEHRSGIVTPMDCNAEENDNKYLKLQWLALKLEVERGGKQIEINKSGFKLNKGERVAVQFVEKIKVFEVGSSIKISLEEFQELVFTGYLFLKEIVDILITKHNTSNRCTSP